MIDHFYILPTSIFTLFPPFDLKKGKDNFRERGRAQSKKEREKDGEQKNEKGRECRGGYGRYCVPYARGRREEVHHQEHRSSSYRSRRRRVSRSRSPIGYRRNYVPYGRGRREELYHRPKEKVHHEEHSSSLQRSSPYRSRRRGVSRSSIGRMSDGDHHRPNSRESTQHWGVKTQRVFFQSTWVYASGIKKIGGDTGKGWKPLRKEE